MRVLLADDDAIYRRTLQQALERWGCEVILASNGNEAWGILQSTDPPQIAILDWMMPGIEGINICRWIREQVTSAYVYIILITARSNTEDVIEGLDAQADDYLIKPFDLRELRARLQSGRRIINMQASQALMHRELSYRATHDFLTGIWNRQGVIDILERELESARKSKKPLCLAIADIDDFKSINDTYGHIAGDAALTETVRRMQSALRHCDNIGRYGGEEFIVVMPGIGLDAAVKIAERLLVQVAARPYEVLRNQGFVTLSIGIASDPRAGDTGLLLRSADEALYRAKTGGRNRIEIASGSPVKERRGRH